MALFEEKVVQTRKEELQGSPKDAPKNDKILVCDADTLLYSVASVYEYPEALLPAWNYEEEDLNRLMSEAGYDEATHSIYHINLEKAMEAVQSKIDHLMFKTGCATFELHFTSGRNFRYTVDANYKANRKSTRYPVGLREMKDLCVEQYAFAIIHSEIEADDWVVYLKKKLGDNIILAAVDKDVLRGTPGTHFNYYESIKYNIPMKWVTTTVEEALRFPYIQCLEGDTADGIPGVKGIGPAKALKALAGFTTETEYWAEVVRLYESKGMTVEDAVRTMQLVSMNQLDAEGNLTLWEAPNAD